jgi:hypothetical protein
MYTIELIEQKLQQGQNSPHDLAEMRAFLASAYSFYTGKLQEILERKPQTWILTRPNHKSDTATDRAWEATIDGIEEMKNNLTLKRIDKLMSGINSLLKVAEGEAKNIF